MRVQVQLRAEGLDNVHRCRGKKSSPYAVIETTGGPGPGTSTSQFVEVGRTEVIHKDLDPAWATIVIVEHDEQQNWTPLRIKLYDCRSSRQNEGTHEDPEISSSVSRRVLSSFGLGSRQDPTLGEVNVEIGEILHHAGPWQEKECDIDLGGSLFVHVTASVEGKDEGEFVCQLRGLDFKNIEEGWFGLGAIDPYFELSKKFRQHGGLPRWQLVHRSEHIWNIVNPYWSPFRLSLEKLCHNEVGKELKLAVFDYSEQHENRRIGELLISVDELRQNVTVGGNASRLRALPIKSDVGTDEEEEVGLLVVLKADIVR